MVLSIALTLGPIPALAEDALSDEAAAVEVQGEEQADTEDAADIEVQAVAEDAADPEEAPSLPGGIIGDDYAEGDASDGLLVAQGFGDGLLKNHTEWTALGLFEYIMQNSAVGSPEYRDAQAAIDVLRGTSGNDMQKQVAAAIGFGDLNDAVSLTSMDAALDYIDSYNSYRARENKEEGTNLSTNVGTNCFMLAVSIAQCDWSRATFDHSQAYYVGENLAWGYADPFEGWYVEEKEAYKSGSGETGHYESIVDPYTELTGFAVCRAGASFGVCYEQSFSSAGTDEIVYSTQQFRDRWFDGYITQQWRNGLGAAVSDATFGVSFSATSEGNLTRYAGTGALDTMQAILRADGVFNDFGGAAIVATADGYWDALAAAGLAGTLGAPVIITSGSELSDQARSELTRLQPSSIVVVGGRGSVSDDVFNELGLFTGNVKRIAGATAVETANEIYEAGSGWGKTAIVATSSGYWDALAAGPYAFRGPAPIFLTGSGNRLTSSTLDTIKAGGFTRVVIVGGKGSVDGGVEAQLKSAGVGDVVRLAGQSAVETSAEIATWELGQNMDAKHVGVATVDGYWDALTAAPVCGKQGSVLVLATTGRCGAIETVYKASPAGGFAHVHVIGGRGSVSDDVWNWLLANAKAK